MHVGSSFGLVAIIIASIVGLVMADSFEVESTPSLERQAVFWFVLAAVCVVVCCISVIVILSCRKKYRHRIWFCCRRRDDYYDSRRDPGHHHHHDVYEPDELIEADVRIYTNQAGGHNSSVLRA